MNLARTALVLLLSMGAGVTSAIAEITPDSMATKRPAREVKIIVQGLVEYNPNTGRVSAATAALQSIKAEDVIYAPSLDLNIVLPVGRQAVFLRGTGSYEFHRTNKQLETTRINGAAGIANRLGPCGTTLTGTYQRGNSQLNDLTLVSRVDNIFTAKGVNAGVTCIRPPGIGVFATGSYVDTSNSITSVKENDSRTVGAGGGIVLGRPTSGSFALLGNYSRSEYPRRTPFAGSRGDFDSVGAGVRVERRLGGRIQATATVNYTHGRTLQPPLPLPGVPAINSKFDGITYAGNASFRATSRLTAQVNFQRELVPTLIAGQSFQIDTSYGASADYRLGNRLVLSAGAQKQMNRSQGGVPIGVIALRSSDTQIYSASARYALNKKLSFTLLGTHEERTTNAPEFDYSGERVGLTANVNF